MSPSTNDKDNKNKTKESHSIKVTVNGPYIVTGNTPLSKKIIQTDDQDFPLRWREVETYPPRKSYVLCRCGKTKKQPYCDNNHKINGFNGTETAGYSKYHENIKTYDGPELKLTDNKPLCVGAGFCTRAGNIWNLTVNSDNPEYKEIAIQEAADCPSGRLVIWDKQGNPIEPIFTPNIVITEDENKIPGPIWVQGEISIESSEGKIYEKRNRVTLCRCGKSKNKPLCDGAHLE